MYAGIALVTMAFSTDRVEWRPLSEVRILSGREGAVISSTASSEDSGIGWSDSLHQLCDVLSSRGKWRVKGVGTRRGSPVAGGLLKMMSDCTSDLACLLWLFFQLNVTGFTV